ncbi:hypothetical protein TNCV_2743061 [Trichonephila clavipes]|nr:hypothetical protein TNCV_2743061 [Trichonephila clavipes]
MAIKYGMPIEAFNQFRSYVATEIRELDFTVENEIMYKDLKSSIVNIQNDFVITYVDKVSANYAIMCKYYYRYERHKDSTRCQNGYLYRRPGPWWRVPLCDRRYGRP